MSYTLDLFPQYFDVCGVNVARLIGFLGNLVDVRSDVMKALRIIGANINQIAKKANETNNIYAADVEALRKEIENIGHTLSLFLANLPKLVSAA